MRSVLGLCFWLLCTTSGLLAQPGPNTPLSLNQGWTLESGCHLTATGAEIASVAYKPTHADRISVPSTVLAAQVVSGEFPDPFFAMNLRKIPGMDYPLGGNFSNLPMPADSPYHCSWWYRKSFSLSSSARGRSATLNFGGINYRANIWLNGKLLADSKQVAGAYRTYSFPVTQLVKPGAANVLAAEVFAPTETDLGINWVDWSPCPPDKDMGINGTVTLATTGPVTITSPMVATHFRDASLAQAELTVYGDLLNTSNAIVRGVASIHLLGMSLQQPVELQPGEHKTILFSPEQYQKLAVPHPSIWWPYSMGTPHLESLSMTFTAKGRISDHQETPFGIREVTSELTPTGDRLFRVNGKPILIRGGGWSQDMMLRENPERLREEFALVRDLNLNTIRLEGKLETEDFYNLADKQGVLVMAGWCCCDQWEHWDKWSDENRSVAGASLQSQMLRLRSHPSLLVWLNGSDNPPPANVEQMYLGIEKQTHWPNPTLSSASGTVTTVTGRSGVKMSGPYDFVAPSYWLVDKSRRGGAFGYNTETSPGPAIPTVYSLRKFLPADKLWPLNQDWNYHNGGEGFQKLSAFDGAMDATYGTPDSLDDYERISQAMAYDGERAMFEAYSRNKYVSTGVVQWMLNNAWPSTIWHLFDYYLDAAGGYFGARKACEPVHIQYSYDDHSIFVVNSTYAAAPKLQAVAHVYDLHLKPVFSGNAQVEAGPDSSNKVLTIPDTVFAGGSQLYFVQLRLLDSTGRTTSENFYWVPAKLTTFDWSKTDYTHTPALTYEKMTALRALPSATVTSTVIRSANAHGTTMQLANHSQALAFQVAVRALDSNGDAIEPVFWSDNYVALMPGEERTVTATLWPAAHTRIASVVVSGWNVAPSTLHVPVSRPAEKTVAQR
jgi:exo-1,4-beta-D-glucosaminidase